MKRTLWISSMLTVLSLVAPAVVRSQDDAWSRMRGENKPTLPHANHTVQPGETLFRIAEIYYGNGYRWTDIVQFNTWVDPDHLIVGSTLYIPNPVKRPASGGPSTRGNPGTSRTTQNPSLGPTRPGSLGTLFRDLGGATFFGVSIYKVLLFLAVWFVVHAAIQGSFVWFAAHLSFVKEVSFGKAMRATIQAEGLATIFLLVVGLTTLAMVYVGTAPPGKPSLVDLLGTVESYLGSSVGMAVSGFLLVGLYVFLGIRFIPQTFNIPGTQGFAVVFLAILVPHLIFLYLLGSRLGFIGG